VFHNSAHLCHAHQRQPYTQDFELAASIISKAGQSRGKGGNRSECTQAVQF
jgi:hypothetical protein